MSETMAKNMPSVAVQQRRRSLIRILASLTTWLFLLVCMSDLEVAQGFHDTTIPTWVFGSRPGGALIVVLLGVQDI